MQRFLIVLLALLWTIQSLWAQSVIINEMSQGSAGGKEWVELLTVDEGVDIRGWELGDNDDGVWHSIAEFSSHSELSNLARGTIIVIYNSGDVDETITAAGGEDTTFSDKSVLLGVNNTSFLTDTGPWGATAGAFANSDGDDAPAIRNASDIIIHDLAVTHPTATISGPGNGKVKYFTGNTTAGLGDNTKWIEAPSTSGTPGVGNGGDNSSWVDSSLPVELTQWAAQVIQGVIQLSWTTDSELENQGFIIERRLTLLDEPTCPECNPRVEAWIEIASFCTDENLIGQGSTTNSHEYYFLDQRVETGETYSYRLSDVDYQGAVTLHQAISVTLKEARNTPMLILHKAFPNPFNPEVTLSFDLEQEIYGLALEIYDLTGAFVQQVNGGFYTAGTHEITWDGLDAKGNQAASGVYLVRLAGQNVARMQRVTLLR